MENNEFICESCNKTFNAPEKINKFLAVCGLLLVYGLLPVGIGFIMGLIGVPLYIMAMLSWLSWGIWIIGIVHIIITVVKDTGRGKCPHCGATDFISINSVKGQNLLKQIKKIRQNMEKQKVNQ